MNREQDIRWKGISENKELLENISKLRIQRNRLQELSISEILQSGGDELINDIRNDKLLVYLLRYGYIDEGYYLYISYFYEGSITKEDNDFLLSVKNHELKPFSFRLTKVDQLIKKLRPVEFESAYVLNFSLVDYLLANKIAQSHNLRRIFSQFISKQKTALDFLNEYISKGKAVNLFIEGLSIQWSGFWIYIDDESGFAEEKKDEYLRLLIKHATNESLKSMNVNRKLSEYISKRKNFLSLISETAYQAKVKNIVELLNVRFESLDTTVTTSDLFNFIYETNHYQLNQHMISMVLMQKCSDVSLLKNLPIAHYTTIKKSGCTFLLDYINANIEQYIENVFLNITTNTQESEETIIGLLDNDDLADSVKESIVEKEITPISDIRSVDSTLWEKLFSLSRAIPVWTNILKYYDLNRNVDKALVQFLNVDKNFSELARVSLNVDDEFDEELVDSLKREVLLCDSISDNSYVSLLNSISDTFEELDFKKLSQNKVEHLLKNGNLLPSTKNFSLLKSKFPNLHITLLERNSDRFLRNVNDYGLDASDYTYLLNSTVFSFNDKQTIVNALDDALLNSESPLVDVLFKLVLSNAISLSTIQTDKLFEFISTTKKIKILTSQIANLSHDDITKYLKLIGDPYDDVTIRSNPLIDNNEVNLTLLAALKSKDYISSYTMNENKIRVYSKRLGQ